MNRCYCKTSTKTDHYQIILFLVLYILQVKPSNIDTPPLNITSHRYASAQHHFT